MKKRKCNVLATGIEFGVKHGEKEVVIEFMDDKARTINSQGIDLACLRNIPVLADCAIITQKEGPEKGRAFLEAMSEEPVQRKKKCRTAAGLEKAKRKVLKCSNAIFKYRCVATDEEFYVMMQAFSDSMAELMMPQCCSHVIKNGKAVESQVSK